MINYKTDKSNKRRDSRGFLVDFIKGDELPKRYQKLGQIYLVTFDASGVIRGNHYHTHKDEWFVVIKGKVQVVLEDIQTKEKTTFELDGDSDEYERIFVGKNTAHAFKNITETAIMLNYASESYHNDSPDTFTYTLA